jgi:hypothetical protein
MPRSKIKSSGYRPECIENGGLARIVWANQYVDGSQMDGEIFQGFEIAEPDCFEHSNPALHVLFEPRPAIPVF